MRAKDYRLQARQALEGNWLLAAGVTLVAFFLRAVSNPSATWEFRQESTEQAPAVQDQIQNMSEEQFGLFLTLFFIVMVAGLAYAFFVSGVVGTGYSRFHLNMVDGMVPEFSDLFSRFKKGLYMHTVKVNALRSLYILGWSLLFLIPGVIAEYSYAMAHYVMLDHPELTPRQCLWVSEAMMEGNRWRLFCLQFSFLGWQILSGLTFGIGGLVLAPYIEAANAAFYRSICDNVNIQNYLTK